MYTLVRTLWNLAVIAGAVAVGLYTHDAGLVAVTFIGGLVVPRVAGLTPRRPLFGWGGGGWARSGWRGCAGGRQGWARGRSQRLDDWHRRAHAQPTAPPTAPPASTV